MSGCEVSIAFIRFGFGRVFFSAHFSPLALHDGRLVLEFLGVIEGLLKGPFRDFAEFIHVFVFSLLS